MQEVFMTRKNQNCHMYDMQDVMRQVKSRGMQSLARADELWWRTYYDGVLAEEAPKTVACCRSIRTS